jgi:uncharacterized DUF497 family protein
VKRALRALPGPGSISYLILGEKRALLFDTGMGLAYVFFDPRLLLVPDPRHSEREPRFHALGETSDGRRLHVTFTLRAEGTRIRVISNLKPTTRSISLRLPLRILDRIKAEANSRDVPYQSLIKVWLAEKLSA